MSDPILSRDQALTLAQACLVAGGIGPATAEALARRVVAAECNGQWQQGLTDVLGQLQRVEAGQVDGQASPVVESTASRALIADASGGFITPAIEQGLTRAADVARREGYCSLQACGAGVQSPGILAPHLEPAADQGLIALGFDVVTQQSAPAGMPLSLALPRQESESLVVDLSAADLAQGFLGLAGTEQQRLPADWVLDDQGGEAADADRAATVGDPVAARMAMIAGLIAAAIGEAVGTDLSDLSDTRDGPRFILIDPVRLGADEADFGEQLEAILALAVMDREEPLPGSQRQSARERVDEVGLRVARPLYQTLTEMAAGSE